MRTKELKQWKFFFDLAGKSNRLEELSEPTKKRPLFICTPPFAYVSTVSRGHPSL
jgi:hypothetical protein